jgi:hypothetical protein
MRRVLVMSLVALSALWCLVLLAMWLTDPGQFLFITVPPNQYSVTAFRGRIGFDVIHLVWPPPTAPNAKSVTGVSYIFNLPIWPLVLLTAVPPAWWLVRRQKSRRAQPHGAHGFPVDAARDH